METLSEAPDESSNNSSQVKSENGSPQHEGGRGSPPPNCAICLGRCRNKSFTDSCLHQFCFKCLLTWSRVKTECPLCKQTFKSIIHNVKSNHQYEEYPVGPNDIAEELVNAARRFRYRTTLTIPRRDTLAIQQFLLHYPLALVDVPRGRSGRRPTDFRRSATDFRCTVYRHNLWARPLPDFTGRFRDCSPEFFRYNDSQVHRLIPWLNRELNYLLNENSAHIAYVLERILELLPRLAITSAEFRAAVYCFFGERTDHFLHEFHCFASTPYDLTGYDRHVQYATDARAPVVNEVLSSSESGSDDSDIVMVSSSHAATPPAPAPPAPAPGPSRAPGDAPAPVYPRAYLPQPAVIPIETISHSDSDSSEVMVVGYIKPPHQRTPELVDLLNSDSDVVVQEGGDSAPVRVTLSRTRRLATPPAHSDSDEPYEPPPPRRRRRAPPRSDPESAISATPPFSSEDDSYEDSTDESSSSAGERARRQARRRARAPRPSHAPRRKRFSRRRKKVAAGSPAAPERAGQSRGTRDTASEEHDHSSRSRERSEGSSERKSPPRDLSEETRDDRKLLRNGRAETSSRTNESRTRTDLRSRSQTRHRTDQTRPKKDQARSRDDEWSSRMVPRARIEESNGRRERSADERGAPSSRREASPDRKHESRSRRDEPRDKRADTRKGKSKNGKGVKSSALELDAIPLPSGQSPALAEPGPSGAGKRVRLPSASDTHQKRLKSVVRVIRGSDSSAEGAGPPRVPDHGCSGPAPDRAGRLVAEDRAGPASAADRARPVPAPDSVVHAKTPDRSRIVLVPPGRSSASSSDDNIPLRHTLLRYKHPPLTVPRNT